MSAAELEPTPLHIVQGKPRLRGVSHQYAFFVSLLAGGLLVWLAPSPAVSWIALVYALSLSALLGTSALYHRIDWTPSGRQWMRRLDHTMIFVLIAGTYTPIGMLVLDGGLGEFVLWLVWSAVLVGAFVNLVWVAAPKWVHVVLYMGVAWMGVLVLPDLFRITGAACVGLLLLGGVFYTVGALAYARQCPNPIPGVFGYHEVFHALVVAAAATHFFAVAAYVIVPA